MYSASINFVFLLTVIGSAFASCPPFTLFSTTLNQCVGNFSLCDNTFIDYYGCSAASGVSAGPIPGATVYYLTENSYRQSLPATPIQNFTLNPSTSMLIDQFGDLIITMPLSSSALPGGTGYILSSDISTFLAANTMAYYEFAANAFLYNGGVEFAITPLSYPYDVLADVPGCCLYPIQYSVAIVTFNGNPPIIGQQAINVVQCPPGTNYSLANGVCWDAPLTQLNASAMVYIGCYASTQAQPALPQLLSILIGVMTPSNCTQIAALLGYSFSAVANGTMCYGSYALPNAMRLPDSQCLTNAFPCSGDPTQLCGSNTVAALYAYNASLSTQCPVNTTLSSQTGKCVSGFTLCEYFTGDTSYCMAGSVSPQTEVPATVYEDSLWSSTSILQDVFVQQFTFNTSTSIMQDQYNNYINYNPSTYFLQYSETLSSLCSSGAMSLCQFTPTAVMVGGQVKWLMCQNNSCIAVSQQQYETVTTMVPSTITSMSSLQTWMAATCPTGTSFSVAIGMCTVPPSSISGGMGYIGCYSMNSTQAPVLPYMISSLTGINQFPNCYKMALYLGFSYSALLNGTTCYAGNNISATATLLPDSMCLMTSSTCGSYNYDYCGSTTAAAVYGIPSYPSTSFRLGGGGTSSDDTSQSSTQISALTYYATLPTGTVYSFAYLQGFTFDTVNGFLRDQTGFYLIALISSQNLINTLLPSAYCSNSAYACTWFANGYITSTTSIQWIFCLRVAPTQCMYSYAGQGQYFTTINMASITVTGGSLLSSIGFYLDATECQTGLKYNPATGQCSSLYIPPQKEFQTFTGCYSTTITTPVLPILVAVYPTTMSLPYCDAMASMLGYTMYGVTNGTMCYAGNSTVATATQIPPSVCTTSGTPCSGSPLAKCGAYQAMAVFGSMSNFNCTAGSPSSSCATPFFLCEFVNGYTTYCMAGSGSQNVEEAIITDPQSTTYPFYTQQFTYNASSSVLSDQYGNYIQQRSTSSNYVFYGNSLATLCTTGLSSCQWTINAVLVGSSVKWLVCQGVGCISYSNYANPYVATITEANLQTITQTAAWVSVVCLPQTSFNVGLGLCTNQTVVPQNVNWAYIGCFSASSSSPPLSVLLSSVASLNSVSACQNISAQLGYTYAGVFNGSYCYADNSPPPWYSSLLTDGNCTNASPCGGSSLSKCGTSTAAAVYGPTPVSSSSQTPFSSSQTPFSSSQTPFSSSVTPFSSSITPFSSSQTPFSSSQTPVSSSQTPFSSSVTPVSSSQTPVSSSQTPFSSSVTPVSSSVTPVSSSQTPFSSSITPVSSSQTPFSSSITPVSSSKTPVSSSQTPVSSSQTPFSSSVTPVSSSTTPVSSSQTPVSSSQTPFSSSVTPVSSSTTPFSSSITQVSSSQTPVSSSQTPVSSSTTPVSSSQTPVSSSQTPVSSSQTPASSSQTPASSSKTPVSSSATPVSSSQTPASSSATPVSSSQTPFSSSITSVSSSQTPVSSSQTPFSSSQTPASSSKTPFSSSTTPVSSSATPVSSSATPASSSVTPVSSSRTPFSSSATPVSSSVTPVSSSLTPVSSSQTPHSSSITPVSSSLTPVSSSQTPFSSSLTPLTGAALCASFTAGDLQSCFSARSSCHYNSNLNRCVAPSPQVCGDYLTDTQGCASNSTCMVSTASGLCINQPIACSSIGTADQCQSRSDCTWMGVDCISSPTSCGSQTNQIACSILACFWDIYLDTCYESLTEVVNENPCSTWSSFPTGACAFHGCVVSSDGTTCVNAPSPSPTTAAPVSNTYSSSLYLIEVDQDTSTCPSNQIKLIFTFELVVSNFNASLYYIGPLTSSDVTFASDRYPGTLFNCYGDTVQSFSAGSSIPSLSLSQTSFTVSTACWPTRTDGDSFQNCSYANSNLPGTLDTQHTIFVNMWMTGAGLSQPENVNPNGYPVAFPETIVYQTTTTTTQSTHGAYGTTSQPQVTLGILPTSVGTNLSSSVTPTQTSHGLPAVQSVADFTFITGMSSPLLQGITTFLLTINNNFMFTPIDANGNKTGTTVIHWSDVFQSMTHVPKSAIKQGLCDPQICSPLPAASNVSGYDGFSLPVSALAAIVPSFGYAFSVDYSFTLLGALSEHNGMSTMRSKFRAKHFATQSGSVSPSNTTRVYYGSASTAFAVTTSVTPVPPPSSDSSTSSSTDFDLNSFLEGLGGSIGLVLIVFIVLRIGFHVCNCRKDAQTFEQVPQSDKEL